ncbi:hypothetical protein BDZ45DRAFT_748238 [Acephala macrosclerotiorum]|nr:hypothetical protein BDZ45DRAFT_748238 [Acephala macrosclerotiorum]
MDREGSPIPIFSWRTSLSSFRQLNTSSNASTDLRPESEFTRDISDPVYPKDQPQGQTYADLDLFLEYTGGQFDAIDGAQTHQNVKQKASTESLNIGDSDEKRSDKLKSRHMSFAGDALARLELPSVNEDIETAILHRYQRPKESSKKHHEDPNQSVKVPEWPRHVEDHAPKAAKMKPISRSSSIASINDGPHSMASISSKPSLIYIKNTEGAAKKFALAIFNDDILWEFWDEATQITSLESLERNLRQLLLVLAKDLKAKAESVTGKRIARFVKSKAAYVSQYICGELAMNSQAQGVDRIADLISGKSNLKKAAFEEAEQSDDSDTNQDNIEPNVLDHLEEIVTQSQAFDAFRANVQRFIRSSQAKPPEDQKDLTSDLLSALPFFDLDNIPVCTEISTDENRLLESFKYLNRKGNSWFRNPPLEKGMKRVTWTCSCGVRMYDDYEELERGAAKKLQRDLRRLSRAEITRRRLQHHEILSNASAGARSLILGLVNFLSTSYRKFMTRAATGPSSLPSYELESQQQPPQAVPQRTTPTERLFLLLCIATGAGKSVSKAYQPTVHDLDSDREFFQMLRRYHTSIRHHWWSWISVWGLQNIYFVNFDLYERSLVDIRELHAVPDASIRTYKYEPTPYKPPIGSNFLMHHYRHPGHASAIKPCLGKVPKKVGTELTVCPIKGVSPGWGLHFEEGLSLKKILTWSCLAIISASILEGIFYCKFKHSVQDALAIGAFILSCFGIAVATLQAWLMIT